MRALGPRATERLRELERLRGAREEEQRRKREAEARGRPPGGGDRWGVGGSVPGGFATRGPSVTHSEKDRWGCTRRADARCGGRLPSPSCPASFFAVSPLKPSSSSPLPPSPGKCYRSMDRRPTIMNFLFSTQPLTGWVEP